VSSHFVPPSWVVGFMALLNVAQLARMDFGHVPAVRAVVPVVVGLGFVGLAGFLTWRQATAATPAAAPDAPTSDASAPHPVQPPDAPGSRVADIRPETARYGHSTLDAGTAAEVLARIDRALTDGRLFARPDLTLAALAHASGSTPHLVSEALNRFGGTSFRDLVTRRRVKDVKAQLEAADSHRFTIEGIGAAAGFRSRSALYDAFRRIEGTTPTAYRDARRPRPQGPRPAPVS
jgi:AraC-like DNA-binding protein